MTPVQLVDFMCYENGGTLIGVVDVSLPEIAFLTESISGAGISGEMDLPSIGQLSSMVTTIKWRSLTDNNIRFAAPKTYRLEFWGSQEQYDELRGELDSIQIKVVICGIPKKVTIGNFEKNKSMETKGEFETTYIKISVDEREKVEIDKFNGIYRVNGVDYMAKIRRQTGRS